MADIKQEVRTFCAKIASAMKFEAPTIATKEAECNPDENYLMISNSGLIENCWIEVDDDSEFLRINKTDEIDSFVENQGERSILQLVSSWK